MLIMLRITPRIYGEWVALGICDRGRREGEFVGVEGKGREEGKRREGRKVREFK